MTIATRERFAMANLTGGELNALVKKVGGEERVREVLRDDVVVTVSTLTARNGAKPGSFDDLQEKLEKTLALLNDRQPGLATWHGFLNERLLEIKMLLDRAFPKMPGQFQTWKTIKMGIGPKTAKEFKKVIKYAKMRISDWANDILGKSAFKVSDTEQDVDLVMMTVAELGFKNGAKYDQICAKAQELGLDLCPNEVGPQLRLQYTDQPKDEWVIIAMEPIADSRGGLRVFSVVHVFDGLWLNADDGGPGSVWNADGRFVFGRRK
jgi:hypothetical protein